MEYISYIYNGLQGRNTDFVVVLPEEAKKEMGSFQWDNLDMRKFDFYKSEVSKHGFIRDYLNKSFFTSLFIRKYVKKHHVDHVFLLSIPEGLPILPFVLPKGVTMSGILYRIYFYEWKSLSLIIKCKDVIETLSLARRKCVRNVFVLNDTSAVAYYNRKYKTNKFLPLHDPVFTTDYKPKNIRNEFHIPDSETMFLQLSPGRRKGTNLILNAINILSTEELKNTYFVFIGRISADIRDDFYVRISFLEKKAHIIVIDEYCSYQQIEDFFFSADVVLVPHLNNCYSSGTLGHAAKYGKPVIGPGKGVLGKLIKRENLGMAMREMDDKNMALALLNISKTQIFSSYLEKNSIRSFTNSIVTYLSTNREDKNHV